MIELPVELIIFVALLILSRQVASDVQRHQQQGHSFDNEGDVSE